MDFESSKDAGAYVLRSKYRSNVLEELGTGEEATPTELADETGDPRPHVSRALSELKEVGVVELRVPEVRNVGRYYALTEFGERVWHDVESEIREIRWSIEEPSPGTERSIVDRARTEFGDALRTVSIYDYGEVTFLYARSGVLESYSEDALESTLRALIYDHPLEEIELPNCDCRSETLHVNGFVILRVRTPDDLRLSISFDETAEVPIPTFSERILEIVTSGDDA